MDPLINPPNIVVDDGRCGLNPCRPIPHLL